jgi:DNA-binding NarL/FixJ family response regulator
MRHCSPPPGPVLSPAEESVLTCVLRGAQQKVIAAELRVAPSTASHRLARALRKIGVHHTPVPLELVVAALLASDVASDAGMVCDARCSRHEEGGEVTYVFSMRRPHMGHVSVLTRAERHVAELLIEGCSRSEIAERRGTAEPTVARQVHAIFSTLRLVGRYELIRRAGELGCFA